MRILQLISSPGVNGAVMHGVRFARLLAAQGHEVVAAARADGWAAQQLRGSIEVLPTSFGRDTAELERVGAFCRARRIQATHSHLTRAHRFGWRLERRTGIPHLAHAHSHHFQFHWFRQRRALLLSQRALAQHRRRYWRRADQVAWLPNYVDPAQYRPAPPDPAVLAAAFGWPEATRALACVAEVAPRKGQLFLVRALPAVAAAVPAVRLVLCGRAEPEAPYPRRVRTEAVRLGVADRIVWAGFRDDVARLLPHFSAAVLPSLAEPFSLAALEAMACGVPVAATDVGGFPEMIAPGENGELVPPRDPGALAAALVRLLADEPRRRRLAAAARARIERDFTPAAHLARFASVLGAWGIGG